MTERISKTETRILLLDDDSAAVHVLNAALTGQGYIVNVYGDGAFNPANLSENPPDLIIVDTVFRGLDATMLPRLLRNARLDIPVIATGPADGGDVLTAFRNGVADYLPKPLEIEHIAGRVDSLFMNRTGDTIHDGDDALRSEFLDLARNHKELTDLLKVSKTFTISGNSKDILHRLTDLAAESMRCEGASILLLNERKHCLEFVVASGEGIRRLETLEVSLDVGIAGWVAHHGEAQIVNDTATDERFTGEIDRQTGTSTRRILAVPLRVENRIIGVLETINTTDGREFTGEDLRVLNGIGERAATVIETSRTIENHQNFFIQTTNLLVTAIERKDSYSEGHGWKVAELSHKIAAAMNLSDAEKNDLHFGSLLHDIGKLSMPSSLFNKRNLSEREMTYIRQHPIKGAKLIEPVTIWRPVVPLILYHHEAWDGSGYPFGKLGDDIPLGSRIINLTESFSVMRATNSYRKQISLKESILEIMRMSGRQFDPDIVKIFITVLEKEVRR